MSGWSTDAFVSNMDAYVCAICREVCRNATTVNCGHTFCQSCITKSCFECPGVCPMCRAMVIQTVPDFSKRLAILGSHTHCFNHEQGCNEVDALSRIMEHTKQCLFRLVFCKLCLVEVAECKMEKHTNSECQQRLVPCHTCQLSVTYSFLKEHTTTSCPKMNTECKYCSWTGLFLDLTTHKDSCLKTPRACKYQKYGCHDTITLESKAEHDSKTDHLSKVCHELDEQYHQVQNYIDSIRPDGPYSVISHNHKIFLCSGLDVHKCNVCNEAISKYSELSLGYSCRKLMCNYILCSKCFPKHRLYKSKQTNPFSDDID